jgi:hypothetical protein
VFTNGFVLFTTSYITRIKEWCFCLVSASENATLTVAFVDGFTAQMGISRPNGEGEVFHVVRKIRRGLVV